MWKLLFIAPLITSGSFVAAQEISETMGMAVRATLTSTKPPFDPELCVADAITQIGGATPVPIRDGRDNVQMLGYGHTPKLIVSLIAYPAGTRLEVRTRTGDMDNKLVRALKAACAIK